MITRNIFVSLCVAIVFGLIIGCNGVVDPLPYDDNALSAGATDHRSSGTYHSLWGMWQCTMNPARDQFEVLPLRTANFTANVNKLLEAQPGNLLIEDMNLTDFFTEGRLDCTITLKHPFPGLNQYNGFDV